jgi:mono/diheme cytochrome c family protein
VSPRPNHRMRKWSRRAGRFTRITARTANSGSIAYDLRQFPHGDKPRFVRSVTEGKNGRMPQWGDLLKPQEIDEIWAYVMTGGVH